VPVVVEGIVGLRKALNKYAPDLRKELDAQVKLVLKPIIDDARSKVPATSVLTNWNNPGYERKSRTSRGRAFPSYDSKIVRRGLTYSLAKKRNNRSGFVSLFTLLNKSAVGAIIETAGRASGSSGSSRSQSNNSGAGAQFIGAMNQIGALKDFAGKGQMTTGRLLYAAYDRNQGKALDAIMKAIDNMAKRFSDTVRQDSIKKVA
jgi:hypothetical protein